MTTEEKIFARRRFDLPHARAFGFVARPGGLVLEKDLPGGDFRAVLTIDAQGRLAGRVVDLMNDEDYAPLRQESFEGPFVASVRASYEELLLAVAEACTDETPFSCAQANRLTKYISDAFGIAPDFPFGGSDAGDCGVFRHPGNRKWFALVMNVAYEKVRGDGDKRRVDIVNLKTDGRGDPLSFPGVFPAYHMNHKTWLSLLLDDTLPDERVTDLLRISFDLTK